MLEEFKKFAFKGNVIDLAVGVIIGSAFGKIVSSLVNDIIMPIFGIILGGINFSNLKYIISPATNEKAEAAIYYGTFIQAIVDFLIMSISIFILIKFISILKTKKELKAEVEEVKEVKKSDETLLLEEIRDLLKEK